MRKSTETLESESTDNIQAVPAAMAVQEPRGQLQAHVGTVPMSPWVVAQQPHQSLSWCSTDSSSAGRRIPSMLSLNLSKGSTHQRVIQTPKPNLAQGTTVTRDCWVPHPLSGVRWEPLSTPPCPCQLPLGATYLRASSGQQLDHLLHELLLRVTTPSWRGTGRR